MKSIKHSAGILLYRFKNKVLQFFLVHPGGPFWAKKDTGAWGVPKGEFLEEQPLDAAIREFTEETGVKMNFENDKLISLKPVTLKSGKIVYAWAIEGDLDEATIKSNVFDLEWPPKSGKFIAVPEVDKAGWFTIAEAKMKINEKQIPLLEEAAHLIKKNS